MLTIEEVRRRLEDRRLSTVSERTNIPAYTLRRLMRGGEVRYSVVQALSDYLEERESA